MAQKNLTLLAKLVTSLKMLMHSVNLLMKCQLLVQLKELKSHYYCEICKKNYDENNNLLTDLTIAKLEHNYGTLIPEVANYLYN